MKRSHDRSRSSRVRRPARLAAGVALVAATGALPGCFCAQLGDALGHGLACGLGAMFAGVANLASDKGRSIEEHTLRAAQLALAYDRASASTGADPFPAFSTGCAVLVDEEASTRLYDLRACARPWGLARVEDGGADTFSIALYQAQLGPDPYGLGVPVPDFTGHVDVVERADGALQLTVRSLAVDASELVGPSTLDGFAAVMKPLEGRVALTADLTAVAEDATHFTVSGTSKDEWDRWSHATPADGGAGGAGPGAGDVRDTVVASFHVDTTCIDGCGAGRLHGTVTGATPSENGTFDYERRATAGTCGHCSEITVTDPSTDAAGCGPELASDCTE